MDDGWACGGMQNIGIGQASLVVCPVCTVKDGHPTKGVRVRWYYRGWFPDAFHQLLPNARHFTAK